MGVQRADARRNRARILEVAFDAFATEGLGVSVHEIARRAGVSTGTVSRHFPAKDDLFEAIVLDRAERLVGIARDLAASQPPGPAFYGFVEVMALEAVKNRAISDSLAGAGFDVQAAAAGGADDDLLGAWKSLLTSAQDADEVRADITVDEVKALVIAGCALKGDDPDQASARRLLSVITTGLRPAAAG
jgi:AcrR family transcriptional regulator